MMRRLPLPSWILDDSLRGVSRRYGVLPIRGVLSPSPPQRSVVGSRSRPP